MLNVYYFSREKRGNMLIHDFGLVGAEKERD